MAALAELAGNGGKLVLTDAAMAGLPFLADGLDPAAVKGGFFYAGWMDFDDGEGPTYDRHHLARAVNKEGTAEGQATGTARGSTTGTRPTSRYRSGTTSAPAGRGTRAAPPTAGRTLIRETVNPGSPSHTGTSLGEVSFGRGKIRIAGGVLPDPTEENYHLYGLFSYALTYTGYQVFENLAPFRTGAGPQVLRSGAGGYRSGTPSHGGKERWGCLTARWPWSRGPAGGSAGGKPCCSPPRAPAWW